MQIYSNINMQEIIFSEKQYLGLNKISFFRRIVIALFCFIFYYIRNEEKTVELLFFLGVFILVISALLVFILHFETSIINHSIILDGLWTARKVKIDLHKIISSEKVIYSKYLLNRSVYNLHYKGIIRFYTRGRFAVKIIDNDGQVYFIGSQKVDELNRIINKKIKSLKKL